MCSLKYIYIYIYVCVCVCVCARARAQWTYSLFLGKLQTKPINFVSVWILYHEVLNFKFYYILFASANSSSIFSVKYHISLSHI